jgi:ABC-2 type transport system ATP-binding protein
MSTAPLLEASDLRVDVAGAAALDRVSFVTRGTSAAIAGDGDGLILAIAGRAKVRAGRLLLGGRDVSRREHFSAGTVGLAPLDPPLPDRFTAREYLAWSARLAGFGRAEARKLAAATLGALELDRLAGARLKGLPLQERRALVIAQAVVASPAVLVATAPLSGLSGEAATYVERVLTTATRGRSWIVSLSSVHPGSLEHALATSADELLVFASGALVRAGKLHQMEDHSRAYTLMLRGKAAEFRAALKAKGVELAGGPRRFLVDLPADMKTQELLALSTEIGAPIVELLPRIWLAEPSSASDREPPGAKA